MNVAASYPEEGNLTNFIAIPWKETRSLAVNIGKRSFIDRGHIYVWCIIKSFFFIFNAILPLCYQSSDNSAIIGTVTYILIDKKYIHDTMPACHE